MPDSLDFYANRLAGNRLPGLLRELAEAIRDEDNAEQLRRLGTSLREMGNIASNKYRERK
jgi:hypothetical protein